MKKCRLSKNFTVLLTSNHCVVLAIALVLSVPQWSAAIDKAEIGYFKVPYTTIAPKIDGQIDKAEWENAVGLTGFSTLSRSEPAQADNQTKVLLMYDDDNLYITFNSELVGKKPKSSKSERDSAVYHDDSIEIMIAPPGLKEGQFYQMIENAEGVIFDYFHGGEGIKWNANWKVANYIWDFEWICEISVPLADLGVKDPMQGTWRFNFCRSYEQATMWSNPAIGSAGYLNYDRFAYADFAKDIAAMKLRSLDGLQNGNIAARIEVSNPTQLKKVVRAKGYLVSNDLAKGQKNRMPNRGTVLLPGVHRKILMSKSVRDKSLNLIKLEITDSNDLIYRSIHPFKLTNLNSVTVAATPDTNDIAFEVDLSRVESDLDSYNVQIKMLDTNGVSQKQFQVAGVDKSTKQVLHQDVSELATGTYTCAIDIIEPHSGKVVESVKQLFVKRQSPEWYMVGRTLGRTDRVLPPWTAVTVDSNVVKVWGRDYVLGDRDDFILRDIKSQGQRLLKRGIILGASANGKAQTAQLVKRSAVSSTPTAAQWSDTYTLCAMTVRCKFTAEYDGMVKVEMVLEPTKGSLTLNSLYLDIPVNKQYSQFCNYSCNYYGSDFSGAVGKTGIKMGFQNYVWVGGDKLGLLWFAEGPLNWNYQEEPIHVSRDGIHIDLINIKTQLTKPVKIVFGLMATPVKKVVSDRYALNRVVEPIWCANLDQSGQDNKLMAKTNNIGYREGRTDDGRFIKNVDDGSWNTPLAKNTHVLKNAVNGPGNKHRHNIFYMYFSGTGPRALDFDKYSLLWQRSPKREWDYGVGKHPETHLTVQTCYNSSFADYMLYGIKHLIDESGIEGVYFDGSGGASTCDNEWHGCKHYVDSQGKTVSMAPVFATREFHKRLATMLYELNGDKAFVIGHLSGTIALPILSFIDAYLDGESPGRASSKGGPKTTELTTFDYWRSHAVGGAGGLAPIFLAYTDMTKKEKDSAVYRGYLTMMLPHGVPFYTLGDLLSDLPALRLTIAILRAEKYTGLDKADFYGYWENSASIKLLPSHPDVVCSYYMNRNDKNKVMVIVSNRSKQVQDVVLKLESATFGNLCNIDFQRSIFQLIWVR